MNTYRNQANDVNKGWELRVRQTSEIQSGFKAQKSCPEDSSDIVPADYCHWNADWKESQNLDFWKSNCPGWV